MPSMPSFAAFPSFSTPGVSTPKEESAPKKEESPPQKEGSTLEPVAATASKLSSQNPFAPQDDELDYEETLRPWLAVNDVSQVFFNLFLCLP